MGRYMCKMRQTPCVAYIAYSCPRLITSQLHAPSRSCAKKLIEIAPQTEANKHLTSNRADGCRWGKHRVFRSLHFTCCLTV